VTEHPDFNPVCLQKWSLRMAASKFKTKGKQQYRQKGSEERLVVTVPITRLTTYALFSKST